MILITGASGLLGANLVLTGSRAGRRMGAVIHAHPIRLAGVPSVQLDLTDDAAVRAAIADLRPAAIIHCAAQTNVDEAELNPTHAERLNIGASATIAAAAHQVGARFVYVSTDTVFDGTRRFNTEDDPVNPLNVYGRTKLAGECEAARHNPNAIIARTNMYGWNAQSKQSLAEWILDRLERGETVPGFTDVYFCPILVNDLSDILFEMLDRDLHGVYHVVGAERISKHDFAIRVARSFGLDESLVIPRSVGDAALPARRTHDLSLSTDRAVKALGRAMPAVDEGLSRFALLRDNGYRAALKAMAGSA